METDPPSLESSDQLVWTTEDQGGSSHVRSYECTFCKRGFSNAQALGGHMNIHRRDRAKLKLPSNESQLSLDITKRNPSQSPTSPDHNKSEDGVNVVAKDESHVGELRQLLESSSSEDRKSGSHGGDRVESRKSSWIIPGVDGVVTARDESHLGELRQLPLFVDQTPSNSEGGGREEKKKQSSHDLARVELDLELRLGPEPHDTSTTGTREFF